MRMEPCRSCKADYKRPGHLVCAKCWATVPMAMKASFAAAHSARDMATEAREILRHLQSARETAAGQPQLI